MHRQEHSPSGDLGADAQEALGWRRQWTAYGTFLASAITYWIESVDMPPESKQRIYSWFQNSVGFVGAILMVVTAVSIGAMEAVDAAESVVGRVAIVAISFAFAVGFGVLAIRFARLGVYWRPGGILIRGLIRTFVVDREDIRDIQAVILTNLYGASSYYARIILMPPPVVSVMLTEERTGSRETFDLWWLGASTPTGAQRRIDELTAIIRRT